MRPSRPRAGRDASALCHVLLSLLLVPPLAAAPPGDGSSGTTAEIRRFETTADQVLAVAFLPDGRRFLFATGSPGGTPTDHSVHLWDIESGQEVRRFVGHAKDVGCVAVSPDGRLVAAGGTDGLVLLWEVETGREIVPRAVSHGTVLDVKFAPDGLHALAGTWGVQPLSFRDVSGGKKEFLFGKGTTPSNSVAVTPDRQHAVVGHGDGLLRLWDLKTGKEVRQFEAQHKKGTSRIALSPDGRRALSGSQDGTVRLWDVGTGKQLRRVGPQMMAVRCVAISPDGRRVLVGGKDQIVRFWDLETGESLAEFTGHQGVVYSVAFSPDGRRALSGGADKTVRLWDLRLPADEDRRTLAVLDFADLGPSVELAVLRKALAEMLIGDLSREQELRVVERGRAAQVLGEGEIAKGGLVEPGSARRVGREVAADYLLTGSLAGSPEKITIKAALTRPGAAKPSGEWEVAGPSTKLFDLERDLLAKVRATLGLDVAAPRLSPTVAVLGFKDLSPMPRLKEMEVGFSEMLQAELSGIEDLRLVERAKLDALLREQKLSLTGVAAAESAAKVGRLLGADRMIFGSFIELGTNLRIEARLVDTETAAVLHAETAEGPMEKLAGLFEDLAQKLTRDLSAGRGGGAANQVRAETSARKLEAARHYAAGKEASRQGRHAEAAAAFERSLLLQPENLDAHYWRIDAWYNAPDYSKAIQAALQGLSRPFKPEQRWAKVAFRHWLSACYTYTRQFREHLQLMEQVIAEDPKGTAADNARMAIVGDLIGLGRRKEGIALLKKVVDEWKGGANTPKYEECLRMGFNELTRHTFLSPDAKAESALAVAILDAMMKAVEEKRNPGWDAWAYRFPGAIEEKYALRGYNSPILGTEARVGYLLRILKVFHDLPRVQWEGHLALAKDLEELGRWKGSREAYLYVAEHFRDAPREMLPSRWDTGDHWRLHWLGRVIEARVKAAMMRGDPLKDKKGAAGEIKEIVRTFGMAHQQAAILAQLCRKYDEPIAIPGKSALIVGGGPDGWLSWSQVLEPLGYTVHPYDLDSLTAAHLAPYSLVILARQGALALEPSETLAFRSYVATGGALLVVVSPGWDIAAPSVTNALLAFFGAKIRPEALPVRVPGELIGGHPIAEGLDGTGLMAKAAVAIEAPAGTAVVRHGDANLLVALPYHEGRVVVSSFGQWLLPDISGLGEWWTRSPGRHNHSLIDAAPLEGKSKAQLPLLKKVIAWLAEPVADRPEGRRLPEDFLKAHAAALEVIYWTRPRETLTRAMDALVAGAGERREEALWVAGESVKPLQWLHNDSIEMVYSWKDAEGPPRLDPRYFEELIRAYPRSELAPFARWEAAEVDRVNRFYEAYRNRGREDPSIAAAAVIPAFEKVEAPKGSHAWAWARLRLAMLSLRAGQADGSLEQFRVVADAVDAGPEKVLALFGAAEASESLGKVEQAGRYYQFLMEAPEVTFPSDRENVAWAPILQLTDRTRSSFSTNPSHYLAKELDKALKKRNP